jgi:gas vesicle protein
MRSFVAGLGVGCAIGVFLAPMSGVELRNRISDRGNLADEARNKINAVTDPTIAQPEE